MMHLAETIVTKELSTALRATTFLTPHQRQLGTLTESAVVTPTFFTRAALLHTHARHVEIQAKQPETLEYFHIATFYYIPC